MERIEIKPFSVNDAWKGRRYRTDEYKNFKDCVLLMLKPKKIPEGKLLLKLKFGFSSTGSDIDNPIKTFLDCLQAKYRFNDSRIWRMEIKKEKTRKGKEFIEFEILSLE